MESGPPRRAFNFAINFVPPSAKTRPGGACCSASASASGERAAALASDVALFCSRSERKCAAQTCGVWTLDNSNLEGKMRKDSRFISSQAAPRRRFFQHLDHQVKHEIESPWTICPAGKIPHDRSSFCHSKWIGLVRNIVCPIFPLQTSHVELYCRMGFQFVLDSISHTLGSFHSECPGWHSRDHGVFFLIPRKKIFTVVSHVQYNGSGFFFLSSPVCVQRE